MRKHSTEKPYKCSECGRMLKTEKYVILLVYFVQSAIFTCQWRCWLTKQLHCTHIVKWQSVYHSVLFHVHLPEIWKNIWTKFIVASGHTSAISVVHLMGRNRNWKHTWLATMKLRNITVCTVTIQHKKRVITKVSINFIRKRCLTCDNSCMVPWEYICGFWIFFNRSSVGKT